MIYSRLWSDLLLCAEIIPALYGTGLLILDLVRRFYLLCAAVLDLPDVLALGIVSHYGLLLP